MKFANQLTIKELSNFIKSVNINAEEVYAVLPNTDSSLKTMSTYNAIITTDKFDSIPVNFSDSHFYFGTTPRGFEDKEISKSWRLFLAKKFKEEYLNHINQKHSKEETKNY